MAIAREAEPVGSLSEVREAGLDREDLLGIYRNMMITRAVEERGHILYRQGKIPGSFYTGRGNEAASVALATAMQSEDVGTPLHRDMGVHITRGVEPWRISGLSCSISFGESSLIAFTSTLSITASKMCCRGPNRAPASTETIIPFWYFRDLSPRRIVAVFRYALSWASTMGE